MNQKKGHVYVYAYVYAYVSVFVCVRVHVFVPLAVDCQLDVSSSPPGMRRTDALFGLGEQQSPSCQCGPH